MYIKLADLVIRIENHYPYIESFCRDYFTEETAADFDVVLSEADILAEDCGRDRPDYAESLAVYRIIAEKILSFDGFLMHGAVLETGGQGVAFLARSGVGKSTHVALWQELLGDKMTVINGDKPLIRFSNGVPLAYGTPWAGKERMQKNTSTPLRAVCFLERSPENSTEKIEKNDVLLSLLPQVYMPKNSTDAPLLLSHLDRFIGTCDFYKIKCNMDIGAATTAYRAIFG